MVADEESRLLLQVQEVCKFPEKVDAEGAYCRFVYIQSADDLPVILSSHL